MPYLPCSVFLDPRWSNLLPHRISTGLILGKVLIPRIAHAVARLIHAGLSSPPLTPTRESTLQGVRPSTETVPDSDLSHRVEIGFRLSLIPIMVGGDTAEWWRRSSGVLKSSLLPIRDAERGDMGKGWGALADLIWEKRSEESPAA
ncbi:hypothetical protein VNO77_37481 [Canavalia gladiata]|uniref:Uncharacterized protein n=1 Tax=Canavalia gladiata TaxID=3824 RepID=A0AAN9KAB8_CANGL